MSEIDKYYQMFGLKEGASKEEVKQAYRDLVSVWHPDCFANNSRLQQKANEKLREINLAYKKLMEYMANPSYKAYKSTSSDHKESQDSKYTRPPEPEAEETKTKEDADYQSSQTPPEEPTSKGLALRIGIDIFLGTVALALLALIYVLFYVEEERGSPVQLSAVQKPTDVVAPRSHELINLEVPDIEPIRPPFEPSKYPIDQWKRAGFDDHEIADYVNRKHQADLTEWATQHKQWRERHPNWKDLTRYDDLKRSDSIASAKPSLPKKSEKKPIAQSPIGKTDAPILVKEVDPEPENPNVLPLGAAPFDFDIRGGASTLTVDNGTETDALVRVIRLKQENIRNFFIPAGKKFTAESLPPGNYVLRVAYGRDWNPNTRRFNYRRSFSETEVFNVTESEWNEPTEDGYIVHTRASEMSITLHKVLFGNFKAHPISEEEFWQ